MKKSVKSKAMIIMWSISLYFCCSLEGTGYLENLELSDYVTIVVCVPESHAEAVRVAMGNAGAGKIGNYSHCSYSSKGIGIFMPNKGANPHIGEEGVLEQVIEERIETVCSKVLLEKVLEEIKLAHPYEEAVIDIYPVYEIGRKKAKTTI